MLFTLYTALATYFIVEIIRVFPPVTAAIKQGIKPWACYPCLIFWVGCVLYLLYSLEQATERGIRLVAAFGVCLLVARLSHALKTWADARWAEVSDE